MISTLNPNRGLLRTLTLTSLLGWMTSLATAQPAGPELMIQREGSDIRVLWPNTNGFRLQSIQALDPLHSWMNLTGTVVSNGLASSVVRPATNNLLFFRLFKPISDHPQLSSLTLSTNQVDFAQEVALHFNFVNPGDVFTFLTVTRSNWTGVVTERLNAETVGLTPEMSSWSNNIPGRLLSLGTNYFRLVLTGADGSNSAPLDFQIVLGATGPAGTAPSLNSFDPPSLSIRKPSGPRDHIVARMALIWSDPDADIERVRIRILRPDGREDRVEEDARGSGFIGVSGRTELNLVRLSARDPQGLYEYHCELIDRGGGSSGESIFYVGMAVNGSVTGPSISGAYVDVAASTNNTVIDIYGNGFAIVATNNFVTLNGEPLQVTSATASAMRVTGALGIRTGLVRLQNDRGVAFAPFLFGLPSFLGIYPTNVVLSAAQSQQFSVEHNAATGAALTWSVNGIVGGNTAVGQISNGLYSAPANIESNQVVSLTVSIATNAAWKATIPIQLKPRVLLAGGDSIKAAASGTLFSVDGRAQIQIPAGALGSDTLVTLRNLYGAERPPAPLGKRILSAIQFGPDGLAFATPVKVTFPLLIAQTPGATLPVKQFIPATGAFVNEGIVATVSKDGAAATALLSHFSTFVIEGTSAGATGGPAPEINSLTSATPLQEGQSAPVRIAGANLNGDLEPQILNMNGSPTAEVTPGVLFAAGTEAGLTLQINVLRDLAAGQSRQYRLRLNRGDGVMVETTFTVAGLDELNLRSGQLMELSDPPPKRWSEIVLEPGSTVRLARGTLSWEATGPVRLDGLIDARGRDGRPGVAAQGGLPRLMGGAGGQGRIDNGCWCFVVCVGEEHDCAEPENFGRPADFVSLNAYPYLSPPVGGLGGGPGHNRNIVEDFFDIIVSVVRLIADGVACAGTLGSTCAVLVADVAYTVSSVADLFDQDSTFGETGSRGVPAAHLPGDRHGHGGGGGGGGGRYSYILSYEAGGGGGAGGDGGAGVEILGGREVVANGRIETGGGNGGAGSLDGERVVVREGNSDQAGFSGGAGGGGSGGDIRLLARNSFVAGRELWTDARGGVSGLSGLLVRDPSRNVDSLITPASQRAADGRLEKQSVNVDPATLDHRVVAGSIFIVAPGSDTPNGAFLRVRGELAGQNNVFPIRPNVSRAIQLFPGFNRVSLEQPNRPPEPFLEHLMLALVGGDADGDSLYDVDEILLGTDPNDSDADNDGLNDGDEIRRGTNPTSADSDDDGAPDNVEIARGLDPLNPDTDGNGVWDSGEIFLAAHPFGSRTLVAQMGFGGIGGTLGFLDVASGDFGVWGKVPGNFMQGLAADDSANLYYTQFGDLFRMNLADAFDKGTIASVGGLLTNVTRVGSLGNNRNAFALAVNPLNKKVFAIQATGAFGTTPSGQVLSIDPATGAATPLPSSNAQQIRAIAFDSAGGFFGLATGAVNDQLVRMDPSTGLVTGTVGALGETNSFGLDFGWDGGLRATATPMDGAGKFLLMPTNGPAGSVQRAFPFNLFAISHLRCPRPCFGAATLSGGLTNASMVMIVNQNNDGIPDLLVTGSLNNQGPAAAWILQGQANATFSIVGSVELRGWAQGSATPVAYRDLNGDGNLDLILINPLRDPTVFGSKPPELVFVFGRAGGGFEPPTFEDRVANVKGAVALDVDQDTFMDVVTLSVAPGGDILSVFINQRNGTFAAPVAVMPAGALGSLSLLAAADINNDTRQDLVVRSQQGLTVLLSVGTGFGNPIVTQSTQLDSGLLSLGDINRDGFLDITVGRYGGGFTALAGNGAGGFQQPFVSNLPQFASGVYGFPALGDLNGDLRQDAVQAAMGDSVEIFLAQPTWNPPLRLAPLHTLHTGFPVRGVALADMNADGFLDIIAVGGNNVGALLQEPPD